MEKIKVSKEVFNDLEFVSKYHFDKIIEMHINKKWSYSYSLEFRSLQVIELAKALINGYEIEETPEEKLASEYRKSFMEGSMERCEAICKTLEILNIKIKDINS